MRAHTHAHAHAPGIEATEVKEVEREFNPDFLKNMIDRLDWDALLAAATTVGAACVRTLSSGCSCACA
jgi:hypothetical protein